MAWETRPRGGRYYTRSRKVEGRVIREYVGGGRKGELAAREDAHRAAIREAERASIRAERDQVRAIDAALMDVHRTTDILIRGALLAAGFERYQRQWRKRRDQSCQS